MKDAMPTYPLEGHVGITVRELRDSLDAVVNDGLGDTLVKLGLIRDESVVHVVVTHAGLVYYEQEVAGGDRVSQSDFIVALDGKYLAHMTEYRRKA